MEAPVAMAVPRAPSRLARLVELVRPAPPAAFARQET
jgi:hypothetical protein